MNRDSNEMLTALYKFWEWEADWMTCRHCGRHLIASRDGEEFVHAAGCKNADLLHPWRSLRLILNGPETDTTQKRCHCGLLMSEHPNGTSRECYALQDETEGGQS